MTRGSLTKRSRNDKSFASRRSADLEPCPGSCPGQASVSRLAQQALWIGAGSELGDQRIVGRRRRQIAGGASAQKMIERRLDLLLRRVWPGVAHPGLLELGVDDVDAILLGLP